MCLFLKQPFQGASQKDFPEFKKIRNDFSRSKTFQVILQNGDPFRSPFKISWSVSQKRTLTPSDIRPENKMTPDDLKRTKSAKGNEKKRLPTRIKS